MNKIVKRVLIFLFSAILIFYGSYQFYLVKFASYSTDTVIKTTVYDTVETTGVFIRNEEVYQSPDGVVVQSVDEGGKISKGGEIAKTFADENVAKNYVNKLNLEEKLHYYEDLKSSTLGEAMDIKSIDNTIFENVNTLIRNKNNSTLDYMPDCEQNINDSLIRRQLLTGVEIDFDPIINSIKSEISSLGVINSTMNITSELSGNFYSFSDGYETVYDIKNINSITYDEVKSLAQQTSKKSQNNDNFGKVIKDFSWYVVCNVKRAEIGSLKIGNSINVVVDADDDITVKGKVVSLNPSKSNGKDATLVIKCTDMNEKIAHLRNEKISLQIKSHTGYRVDKRGIHTINLENGDNTQKGVYVLIGPVVKFRNIKIVYDAGDYVICDMSATDVKNNIELYDPVIVEGRELYDGKYVR